jgi:DUF4097 and DUF4098 domain-containing protein YvlB
MENVVSKFRKGSIMIIIIIGLVLSSKLFADDLKVLHEKSFPIQAGKTLKVDVSTGDIKVTSWEKEEVYVKISGNKKAEEKVNFSFSSDDEGVSVYGKREGGFWGWFSGNIRLKLEIFVPSNFNIKMKTSGGDMYLSKIVGDIKLSTSGGDLNIKESEGNMHVTTSGGDITLNSVKGKFQLTTSGGDIKAVKFEGSFKGSTSGGDIELKSSYSKIEASTSGGDIKLEYTGDNQGIQLSTSGGDIDVYVPSDFNAKADLKTSGGDISCNLPTNNVVKISSSKYEADLNNGGNVLICKTSGGDIKVKKR